MVHATESLIHSKRTIPPITNLRDELLIKVIEARFPSGVNWWPHGDEKDDVMLSQPIPLVLDVVFYAQVDGDVCTNSRRLFLANVWFRHLDDAEGQKRQCHSGPTSENDLAVVCRPRLEPRHSVFDVASDFVSRFQLKQFEVSK